MKKLFLISNAHIDPVWLWEWQEGATATIATFRAVADFCEEFEGYVFCHNEALLYQWTEEYDPVLFARIQRLVEAGKWHIMGGWFLQPDCNIPSGESMLRQILSGRRYFEEKFRKKPTVAINFDSFGHSRGMVQILNQCGYEGYVFRRPQKGQLSLPALNFRWKGFDGSEVIGHRLSGTYGNLMGEAAQMAEQWSRENAQEQVGMFCWGVGNHGGGPSRVDLNELKAWMEKRIDMAIRHATPEEFFAALKDEEIELPQVAEDMRPVFVGCYTSQARVKRLHRQLENELYATEKLAAAAAAFGLMEYPRQELEQAQWDMMLNEFHDTLPGTTIETAAAKAEQSLAHGLEITSRVKMRGFMAMLAGQSKAKPEEVPIFIYNPHPYPVTDVFACEFMPADQNWSSEEKYAVAVWHDGKLLPSQQEKPEYNMNLDWRQRVVFRATLEPSSINRFDCVITKVPVERGQEQPVQENIEFRNDRMAVTVNAKTGLVDSYSVDGVSYLQKGSFSTVLYEDSADPWKMEANAYTQVKGAFAPVPDKMAPRYTDGEEITVPAVRIVEDGPVRMVVEAEFQYGKSSLTQTYRLPRQGTAFEVEQRICWNEQDTMAKLVIPCAMEGTYMGQSMFGSGSLPQDGTECVSQQWSGIFGPERALTVTNTGTYGSHCTRDTMFLSLLRAPAYAAHPIPKRRLVHEDRFVQRADQGVHLLQFTVCGGPAQERRDLVDMQAQLHNEVPYVLSAFPGGEGEKPGSFITVSDRRILLSAMYRNPEGKTVLRLWNSASEPCSAEVRIPRMEICQKIQLPGFRFQTYLVEPGQGLTCTAPE